jgi:hypothetical protein
MIRRVRWCLNGLIICVFLQGTVLAAADATVAKEPAATSAASADELAKKSQNPIADMMSLPFQYNVFYGGALGNSTMSVLNIQPVIPTSLNKDWNLITRAIVPLISMPTSKGNISGTGDSTLSFFFSPKNTGATTWGVGPVFQIPTASDGALGTQTFGIGPTAVVVKIDKQWVYGALANYVVSVGNSATGLRTNQLFIQPFINYNIPQRRGMALSFAPGVTCDFTRDPGNQWTVPLGLAVSQILKIDKQPVSLTLGAYYNAIRPANAPEWNFRFQFTLLFPK